MRLGSCLLFATSLAATSLGAQTITAAQNSPPAAAVMLHAQDSVPSISSHTTLHKGTQIARNDCYSLRSYHFKRDDHHGDTVLPNGYPTCMAASSTQLKSIGAPQAIQAKRLR